MSDEFRSSDSLTGIRRGTLQPFSLFFISERIPTRDQRSGRDVLLIKQ